MRNYIHSIVRLVETFDFKQFQVGSFTSYEIMNNLFMAGLSSLIAFILGLLLVYIHYLLFVFFRAEEGIVIFKLNSLAIFIAIVILASAVVLMLMHLLYGFTNLFLDYLHNVKVRTSLWFIIEVCFISIMGQVVPYLIYTLY